jgi:hypothetical protein
VALVRINVSEECIATLIRVIRISELGTTLAGTYTVIFVYGSPILMTLMMEAIYSTENIVLTRATRRNIPENGILQVF